MAAAADDDADVVVAVARARGGARGRVGGRAPRRRRRVPRRALPRRAVRLRRVRAQHADVRRARRAPDRARVVVAPERGDRAAARDRARARGGADATPAHALLLGGGGAAGVLSLVAGRGDMRRAAPRTRAGWAERAAAHDPDDECRRSRARCSRAVAQPALYAPVRSEEWRRFQGGASASRAARWCTRWRGSSRCDGPQKRVFSTWTARPSAEVAGAAPPRARRPVESRRRSIVRGASSHSSSVRSSWKHQCVSGSIMRRVGPRVGLGPACVEW